MTVGERMKYRRKELKITAEQVAKQLNLSPATIYRYEKGDIEKVPSHILLSIAEALQTTPAWLMGWVVTPEYHQPSHSESFHAPKAKLMDDNLTDEESQLLSLFHQLNQEGRSRVISFTGFCTNDPALRADPPAASVS